MKLWYNPKTKEKITDEAYQALDEEKKKEFREWKDTPPRKGDSQKGINDSTFYYVTEQIGKDVGSIPYNVLSGTRVETKLLDAFDGTAVTISQDYSGKSIAGLMKIRYIPGPGKSEGPTAAVNIAATAEYTWVRHQNSGRANYESSDLMIYILAMDQIYTAYHEAAKEFEIGCTFRLANRYYPRTVFSAMRLDHDDFTQNLANYRARLNLIASKISSLAVPKQFNLFKRHTVVARAAIIDAASDRTQLYIYQAAMWGKYSPYTSQTGGELVFEKSVLDVSNDPDMSLVKYSAVLDQLEGLVDAVLKDEDCNIISGDILKAEGRENLYNLMEVGESATVNLVHDADLLQQIENMVMVNISEVTAQTVSGNFSITQNNNVILYNPFKEISKKYSQVMADSYVLNSYKDVPDWKDNLEWTRNMSTPQGFGSEIFLSATIYSLNYSASDPTVSLKSFEFETFMNVNWVTTSGSVINYAALTQIANFDWHPIIYVWSGTPDSTGAWTSTAFFGWSADLKVYTLIAADTLSRIHDCAIMGELNALLLSRVGSVEKAKG